MAIKDILQEANAHAAEVKAEFGPVPHPHAMIHRVVGVEHMPGDQVIDTVTGQTAEVIHAGIVQTSSS